MNKKETMCLITAATLLGAVMTLSSWSFAQSQTDQMGPKGTTGNATSVSVSSSINLQVSNETVKSKEVLLRGSIVNFLNSGPNVLKTSNDGQTVVKSKIENKINSDTQNVEGIEATNAIISVEIGKALKTLVSSSNQPNQTEVITIKTSSTCTPSNPNTISCVNSVAIS